MFYFKKIIFIIMLSLGISACGSVETKSSFKSESVSNYYSGYFFDASISGLSVIPIQNKPSKVKIKKYIRANDVRWQLDGKVVGGLTVNIKENTRSPKTIGAITSKPQVTFIPLDGQKKSSYKALSKSKDVLVEGSGIVSVKSYATDNLLPSGAYIIRIKVRGAHNWDRKEVYIEVK